MDFQQTLKIRKTVKRNLYRDALLACLRRIPSATAEATADEGPDPGNRQICGSKSVCRGGASRALICQFKDSGQPRWARQAINQLWAYRDDPNTYGVFMAPYLPYGRLDAQEWAFILARTLSAVESKDFFTKRTGCITSSIRTDLH